MTVTLRPMRLADLDEVLAIAQQSPDAPHWKPSDYTPYLTPDASNPALLRTAIVATTPDPHQPNQEKVQAFAAATLLLTPDSAGQQNFTQLDSIAVLPSARRQGVGAALLRAILTWSACNNARHLALEVRAGNVAAIALYHRCGLRPEGRRPRYYTDPEEDALLLGMEITPDYP
jgi:[ribosomal protein S18]-alanine N-acetyltransferase